MQFNFGDAGEILAQNVSVVTAIAAQFMKINLLIEIGVFRRAFIALGITGVIKT